MSSQRVDTGSEHVSCVVEDAVARVRLARPEKLNGLTLPMLDALVSAARTLRRDRSLRAVVLSGEGDSFCAGLDFASATKDPSGVARAFAPRPWRGTNTFQEACWAWRRLDVPVLAAVHGHCFGGGVQLALAADVRFTTPDARWSVLEARWGLVPDMSGIRTLTEHVRPDVAKRLTMTGEEVDGTRAVEIGLATQVASDPGAAAQELVEALRTRSPDAVAATKRLFTASPGASARSTLARERREQSVLLVSANTAAARRAALDRSGASYGPRQGLSGVLRSAARRRRGGS